MRLLIAALALALMVVGAQAQVSPQQTQMNSAQQIGQHAGNMHPDDKSEKPKANDKAYNAALRNLPDKQYDPWRGVR
jgi:hypothetical protein